MNNDQEKNIRFLGVDWGEKRLGLALADSETCLATPFNVVNNVKDLLNFVISEGIDIIVLGEPNKMHNNNQDLNPNFKNFLKILKEKTAAPVELIDERLTSKNADALTGNKKNKAPRDAVAAMLILQNYLDKKYGRNL